MIEDRFEDRLDQMFDAPPRFDDSLAFAARVQERLAARERMRADAMLTIWIATGAVVVWGLVANLDALGLGAVSWQWADAVNAVQSASGGWLLPVLALGAAWAVQRLEDRWARD